jgi:predicted GIY-YIG superfamily endonuclease
MPQSCGVYLLKSLGGEVLYVGKAIRIKDRLRQHFRNLNRKGFNIHRKVAHVEFIETHSELLALLLELYLIRLHRPELNKALRNDGYKFEFRFLFKDKARNEVRIVPINKETEGSVIKRFKSRKSGLAFVSGLIASGHLSTENLYFYGAKKGQFALVENINAENKYDHIHDLRELISYVNPFFEGKYLIQELTGSGYSLIKEGDFYGLSLHSQDSKSFQDFEKMCEYKFSYPSALEIVINYAKNHDLLIRRFD